MNRQQSTKGESGIFSREIFISAGATLEKRIDSITVEEPLQIVLRRGEITRDLVVIMRTPVDDLDLACGFLFTEGVIKGASEIVNIAYDASRKDSKNVIVVDVSSSVSLERENRNFTMNSSCGICGKTSIDEIYLRGTRINRSRKPLSRSLILELPNELRKKQEIFSQTGGIHAAGLFRYDGSLIKVSEDVGRHNAVDKIVGYMVMNGLIGKEDYILQVSGRAGFEIVQKAAAGGITIIASVSAPSTLAIETAEAFGITLICFVRKDRFNVYSHGERISSGL